VTIATIRFERGRRVMALRPAWPLQSTVVTITATLQGQQGTALLTVTEPRLVSIQIAPSAAQTINVGDTQPYTVTGSTKMEPRHHPCRVVLAIVHSASPLSRPTPAGAVGRVAGATATAWLRERPTSSRPIPRRRQRTNRLGFARRDSTTATIGSGLNNRTPRFRSVTPRPYSGYDWTTTTEPVRYSRPGLR